MNLPETIRSFLVAQNAKTAQGATPKQPGQARIDIFEKEGGRSKD
jgi:hypothetical protein